MKLKGYRKNISPQKLIISNKIELEICDQIDIDIKKSQEFQPIVVTSIEFARFIILDGNHRAYKLAEYHKNINALIINQEFDRNIILELENRMIIPPFPHREFLTGEKTLSQLKALAKQAAEEMRYMSVADIVKGNIHRVKTIVPKGDLIDKYHKVKHERGTPPTSIEFFINEQNEQTADSNRTKKNEIPFGRDLIEEYYRVRELLHKVPTLTEIDKYGKYSLWLYMEKFGDWEKFVDLMEKVS